MRPQFALSIGGLSSDTASPVGLPVRIVVDRDMDTPADALRILFGQTVDVTPGDPVELSLGYDEVEVAFTGTVTDVRPSLTGAEVRALGGTLALMRLRTSAGYERRDAGAIVSDLANQAGMDTGTIDAGEVLPAYSVDKSVSGYTHAHALAVRFGFELYADREGKLMFHAPEAQGSAATYTYGRDVLSLAGTSRQADLQPAVGGESPASDSGENTVHWLTIDELKGAAADGSAALVLDPAARTQDLADRFAAGLATVEQRTRQAIRLRVLGRPQAELGELVGADGDLAEGLTGSGYVRSLRHVLDVRTGWTTELSVTTSAGGDLLGGLL
jgi:phage protein D